MTDAGHVQFARELELRDERVAAALGALQGLQADVAELRAHAAAIAEFRAAYPGERDRLVEAVDGGRAEVARRGAERAEAESELAHAKPGEPEAAARRALTRATDAEASAHRRLARVEEELAALESQAARFDEQLPRLQARAAELTERLGDHRRVTAVETEPSDLPSLLEWASRARAALFVAAGGLENERDRIVREANELGAAVLGEASLASSVAVVRRRIEESASR